MVTRAPAQIDPMVISSHCFFIVDTAHILVVNWRSSRGHGTDSLQAD